MGNNWEIAKLRSQLLRDVSYLCTRRDLRWAQPIVRTLQEIRAVSVHAVLFGGTLRSLLLARREHSRLGRPRDLDVVVAGTSLDEVRERLKGLVRRETRFGGFHLQNEEWEFDIWPLEQTWAFREDEVQGSFEKLPTTTFLNLEAIAVDIWPLGRRGRRLYVGDNQFFDGILSRTLEINREKNPFPALSIVRALTLADATQFKIGPRLREYLLEQSAGVSDADLLLAQRKHFGAIRHSAKLLREWVNYLALHRRSGSAEAISLPRERQESLPYMEPEAQSTIKLHVLSPPGESPAEQHRDIDITFQPPVRRLRIERG